MQWVNKARFVGQVKPAGIEKSMQWKTGFVDFDYDNATDSWMANLYFKVNTKRPFHQMKIGQSVSMSIKCGRLMIENKKGDGIHIKLASGDVEVARTFIAKIKAAAPPTPKYNRSEVGVISTPVTHHKAKGSENVSPFMNGSYSSDSSPFQSSGDVSPIQPSTWISKKTPPAQQVKYTPNPAPKRKLDLVSKETNTNGLGDEEDFDEEVSFPKQKFTGMKDFSKRSNNGGNALSLTTGLGAKSFYGAQNSQNSLIVDNTQRGIYRNNNTGYSSPRHKRAKLHLGTDSNRENRNSSSPSPSVGRKTSTDLSSTQDSDMEARYSSESQAVGFENLGNTCFMNSPLQCLSYLEPIALDIQSAVAELGSKLKPNSITRMLYLLMKDVRKLDVNPQRVKEILMRLRHDINGRFAYDTQQDAQELLSELLDRSDMEVKAAVKELKPRASTSAALADDEDEEGPVASSSPKVRKSLTPTEMNFTWQFKTALYFHDCKTETLSNNGESETSLLLALEANKTKNLQDCIDSYFAAQELFIKCEKCNKIEKATMHRKVVKRPRCCIITLLRYQTDNLESKKIMDKVVIPRYMSIAEFCTDDVKAPPPMEPVFMQDRLPPTDNIPAHLLQAVKNGQKLSDLSDEIAACSEDVQQELAKAYVSKSKNTDSNPSEAKKAVVSEDTMEVSQEEKVAKQETEKSQDHPLVKELVSRLIMHFTEVDRYESMGDNSKKILIETNEFIESLNLQLNESDEPEATDKIYQPGNQRAICHALLHRALRISVDIEDDNFPDTALCAVVASSVMNSRYCHKDEVKRMDHLIEELCSVLAAKEMGLLTTPNSREENKAGALSRSLYNRAMKGKHNVSFADGVEKKNGEYKKGDDNIKDSSVVSAGDYSNASETGSKHNDTSNGGDSENFSNDSRVKAEDLYQYQEYLTINMILGKHRDEYTEEELMRINCSALTEMEQVAYVEALSRYEYNRETLEKGRAARAEYEMLIATTEEMDSRAQKEEWDTNEESVSMEVCSPCPPTEMVGEELAEEMSVDVDPDSCTAAIRRRFPTAQAEENRKREETSSSSVVGNKAKTAKLGLLTPDQSATGGHEGDSQKAVDDELCLLCHETLNEDESGIPRNQFSDYDLELEKMTGLESLPDTPFKEERCKNCGDTFYGECTQCAVLQQADFELQPFDPSIEIAEGNALFGESLNPPQKVLAQAKAETNQSNTSSNSLKSQSQNSSTNSDKTASVKKTVTVSQADHSPVSGLSEISLKPPTDNNSDHVVPSASPISSLRKEPNLFSPSKPNHLVKSRDYSRLRSPSVSPKKRSGKAQQGRPASATKRLLFPDGEPVNRRTPKNTPIKPENASTTSLEVNIDEASFFENTNSALTPASGRNVNRSLHVSPFSPSIKTNCSTPVPSVPPSPKRSPIHGGNADDCGASPSVQSSISVDPSLPQASSQVGHSVSVSKSDQSEASKSQKVLSSETAQENNKPASVLKSRSGRVLSGGHSNPDEKENNPEKQAGKRRLENIENGRADLSYKLVGIVNHKGESLYAGHYTAFTYNIKKQKWFYTDDKHTKEATEHIAKKESIDSGYLFFYMDKELFEQYAEVADTDS